MANVSWMVCVAYPALHDYPLEPEDEYAPSWCESEDDAIASAASWRAKGYRVRVWRAQWTEVV